METLINLLISSVSDLVKGITNDQKNMLLNNDLYKRDNIKFAK